MSETPSYLRRSLALLEWIRTAQPKAQVTLGSAALGSWTDLAPQWRRQGARIYLQLHPRDRNMAFCVSSVQPAPWGADIKVRDRSRPPTELRVIWRDLPESTRLSQRSMLKAVRTWAQRKLPGCQIRSENQTSDRVHSLSGTYLRLRLRRGKEDHLLLACGDLDAEEKAHAMLTQALLWLACLHDQGVVKGAPIIHLLVPMGHAAVLCHRARLISREQARIEVWEYEERSPQQWETRRPPSQPAPVEDRDFRWPVLGPFRWSPMLERVVDLAPDAIQRYPRFQDYDSLRLWGLEFARVEGPDRDRVSFGVGLQTELTEDNFTDLRALVEEILYYRRADSPAPNHPYYRMQSERWLECLLLTDIASLFPELVPGSVYPQIPVYLGRVPGRVDILGADREGNLVVMELKVSEDPNMPLQSLDYWGRVIVHNVSGDFERRGYFAGLRLSRARPKIYLVSPLFSFHDSLERLLHYLDPKLEVSKIGINEDWRCGVRILRRSDCRCGELQ
jgi:hypothetical protein